MDPFYIDYLDYMKSLHEEAKKAIKGLDKDALDWVPGKEMNSLTVLASHIIGVEHHVIGEVIGGMAAERNRAMEFAASGLPEPALIDAFDHSQEEMTDILSRLHQDDLTSTFEHPRHHTQDNMSRFLLHAMEHTAGHVGHMQITRQMWDMHLKP